MIPLALFKIVCNYLSLPLLIRLTKVTSRPLPSITKYIAYPCRYRYSRDQTSYYQGLVREEKSCAWQELYLGDYGKFLRTHEGKIYSLALDRTFNAPYPAKIIDIFYDSLFPSKGVHILYLTDDDDLCLNIPDRGENKSIAWGIQVACRQPGTACIAVWSVTGQILVTNGVNSALSWRIVKSGIWDVRDLVLFDQYLAILFHDYHLEVWTMDEKKVFEVSEVIAMAALSITTFDERFWYVHRDGQVVFWSESWTTTHDGNLFVVPYDGDPLLIRLNRYDDGPIWAFHPSEIGKYLLHRECSGLIFDDDHMHVDVGSF